MKKVPFTVEDELYKKVKNKLEDQDTTWQEVLTELITTWVDPEKKEIVEEELLTLDEACLFLKIGRSTVYRLAKEKKIPSLKLGNLWRFRKSSLIKWVNSRIVVVI